ncbi:DUF1638 domain-containing protein [Candidatus Contubernalis alkaliaceticus]|uniref:DUF1638 domain-containing protein n=1 Tax=Candidatus Contubernalis alkaliaceticus TaxID=338645 RepID=UPI001F4BEADB|nr:DUF1638 domain-containing protein [Candidatus Contubernalis alkalaceticus]UNC91351.1 DUF1638 domain-containing protein [Candidatus Contubernalis alkalaceticus]
MNNIIIACRVLQDELDMVIKLTKKNYPINWVDSDYHMDPDKLRGKLQSEIDQLKDVDNVLFAFGCCGNGLVGLKASTANLIIPKTDDCISMLMSLPTENFTRKTNTYFLTKGWMESKKSILNEYSHVLKKFGPKKAKRVFDLMLKHYDYLMLIDTGAYKVEDALPGAEEFAQKTNLQLVLEKGDIWFLKKLLTGPYDEHFCIISKGESVSIHHFTAGAHYRRDNVVADFEG